MIRLNFVFLFVFLAGCQVLALGQELAADRVAVAVRNYCENVSFEQQVANRAALDVATRPYRARIDCAHSADDEVKELF